MAAGTRARRAHGLQVGCTQHTPPRLPLCQARIVYFDSCATCPTRTVCRTAHAVGELAFGVAAPTLTLFPPPSLPNNLLGSSGGGSNDAAASGNTRVSGGLERRRAERLQRSQALLARLGSRPTELRRAGQVFAVMGPEELIAQQQKQQQKQQQLLRPSAGDLDNPAGDASSGRASTMLLESVGTEHSVAEYMRERVLPPLRLALIELDRRRQSGSSVGIGAPSLSLLADILSCPEGSSSDLAKTLRASVVDDKAASSRSSLMPEGVPPLSSPELGLTASPSALDFLAEIAPVLKRTLAALLASGRRPAEPMPAVADLLRVCEE